MATIRTTSFTNEEDIQLCHAYIDVSQNAIVGNNQSGETFWKKVQAEYEKTPIGQSTKRQGRSLSCRMSTILKACSKFRGCVNQVYSQNPSGASDKDIINMAKVLLSQDDNYKKGFKFDHVWDLLKDTEKFTNTQSSKTPTPRHQSSPSLQDEYSPSPEESSPTPTSMAERPIGVKKAKRHQQNDDQFKKLMEQNAALLKTVAKGNADRIQLQREKLELRRMKEENRVLFADLSSCDDPAYKANIEKERARIFRRRETESHFAEQGEGSGSQYRAYQASRAENDEDEEADTPGSQDDPHFAQGDYSPYYNYLRGNDPTFPGF